MDVRAAPPASDGKLEIPVLSLDPDFNDLPRDHTEGTEHDDLTQEAVLRLAQAAITALDQYRAGREMTVLEVCEALEASRQAAKP